VSDLRLVSYLAPSLPEGLFVAVATRIAEATGLTTSLRFQIRTSAPPPGEVDPFSSGEADIGFLCSPGYVWMTDLQPPAVRLLAAAPVFDDPRTEGRPVYFSDVVVAHGSPAIRFEDLRGGTWAFNDPCSWSGYLNLLVRLRDVGGAPFFRGLRESGSHLQSIRLIASAQVLRAFGVLRFAPVADEEYAAERAALRRWQSEQQAARLSMKPAAVCGDVSARRT